MLNTKYTRTTITLPEELLFEIKKRALIEKKTIKDIVNEGLNSYVGKKTEITPPITISSFIGAWGKGESGSKFLKRIRYGKEEKAREKYLAKLWKKSF
ncbi:hypothetical protein A2960_06225 [Candidatus Gottesmanbacteria bacterium RIFCSPLOWO2_01_FULL_39_12b]|uniref:Uncharacterized protein n=1 Tax=Candidatus Gottesmanbacteria bacterium RIFCSPLOWO2_01_FULL_39_12b TaxID=1798388 RepID=A0A1F6AP27_9BACT|nr:MAG: hypothetical protein A2960_06225 [Candidatus Gottesmanbacteria bacterium RIFCSPLOWO2_01_FULL_39_12b]